MTMSKIIDTLNNLPSPKNAYGSLNINQISLAEAKLNLHFSSEYKEFLQYVGALVFKGNEICGIVPYPSLDVVSETTKAREHDSAFPKSMYVISSLHIDGILILQNEKGEIFQYIPLQFTKKIFGSLAAYLESL
jgi:hypothetical protein